MYLVIFKLFITTDRRLRKHPFLLAPRRCGRFLAFLRAKPPPPSGEERGETDVFAG